MRPQPPPLRYSIRAPKPAKDTDPHLHINKKNVSNQQVDYRSKITTGKFKLAHGSPITHGNL